VLSLSPSFHLHSPNSGFHMLGLFEKPANPFGHLKSAGDGPTSFGKGSDPQIGNADKRYLTRASKDHRLAEGSSSFLPTNKRATNPYGITLASREFKYME